MSWRKHGQATVSQDNRHVRTTHQQDLCVPIRCRISVQMFRDSTAGTATKVDENRVRRRHGQEDDVGDIHEDVYEKNRPNGEQRQGNIRHCMETMLPMMHSKIESLDHFDRKSTDCNCVWLLQEIQGITHRFEGTRNVFTSLDDAWKSYYTYQQGHSQTLHVYLKHFHSLVKVLEPYGAAIGGEEPYKDAVNTQVMANTGLTAAEYQTRSMALAKQKSAAIGFLEERGLEALRRSLE
jgi:hypothetical protein